MPHPLPVRADWDACGARAKPGPSLSRRPERLQKMPAIFRL